MDELLARLYRTHLDHVSPLIVLIPKKDETLHFCASNLHLHSVMIRGSYRRLQISIRNGFHVSSLPLPFFKVVSSSQNAPEPF